METSEIMNRQRALLTQWANSADPTIKAASGQAKALAYIAALLETIVMRLDAAVGADRL
jgi:hypothetical protein